MISRSQAEESTANDGIFADNTTLGMHLLNRASSSTYRVRKRDQVLTINEVANDLFNYEMFIGARNSEGTGTSFSSTEFSFSFIGEGLTITEENNLVIAINQLQTDLKRNV